MPEPCHPVWRDVPPDCTVSCAGDGARNRETWKHVEMKEIEAAVEGILFASGRAGGRSDRICRGPGAGPTTRRSQVLQKLMDYYSL
ncbi:MAG: hypothetical protein ACLU38_09100 [Dysosmobacter sp.]